jgi:ribosomal protein S21
MVKVVVNGDVDKALRRLKRKLSEDGDQKRLRDRKRFTPQKERKRKKAAKAARKRQRR